jgi:hypothetical protein
VPILIRRIVAESRPKVVVDIATTLRVPESSLRRDGQLERHVERAARLLPGRGGILIVLDCDWEGGCPAIDGPDFLDRVQGVRPDLRVAVVLAKREFESWFLAAADSLRGRRGLPANLEAPANPEEIRGAKEWLSSKMPPTRGYSSTTDQPALAALVDIESARQADSFDKFYREVERLVTALSKEVTCDHA